MYPAPKGVHKRRPIVGSMGSVDIWQVKGQPGHYKGKGWMQLRLFRFRKGRKRGQTGKRQMFDEKILDCVVDKDGGISFTARLTPKGKRRPVYTLKFKGAFDNPRKFTVGGTWRGKFRVPERVFKRTK